MVREIVFGEQSADLLDVGRHAFGDLTAVEDVGSTLFDRVECAGQVGLTEHRTR